MKPELSIEISSNTYNLKVMRIFDTSEYCGFDNIENYLIEVLPVNKSSWVNFPVQKNFTIILNSSNLGYKKVDSSEQLLDLPDGIYEIKQSYKPNIHTLSHYYHLRTTALRLKYIEILCNHFNEECKKNEKTYISETQTLIKIKQYIEAAEYTVNEKHDKECGIILYNQAVEMIKKFENECGCR